VPEAQTPTEPVKDGPAWETSRAHCVGTIGTTLNAARASAKQRPSRRPVLRVSACDEL
jgi:hypothetical protein